MKGKCSNAWRGYLLVVLVAGVVSVHASAAQRSDSLGTQVQSGSVEQQVRAANQELLAASRQDDRETARRLMAAELTWINAEGKIAGKDELLSGKPSPPSNVEVGEVRAFGNSAVLTGVAKFDDGRQVRFLQEWLNRGGQWQLLAHQATPIVATTATAPAGTSGRSAMKGSAPELRSDEDRGVWEAQGDLHQAFLAGDAVAYAKLTSDRFVRIGPNGEQQNKSGFLDNVKQNAGRSTGKIETGEPQITISGDTARVVMTTWGTMPGGEEIRPARVTRVFVKEDGKWQQAAAIFTPVRQQ